MTPQLAGTTSGKTTRYFKGYQAQACAYEGAETYMERALLPDDDDVLELDQHDDAAGYDEEYCIAEIMARNNLTSREQYDLWLDDAVEAFEEARYERLLFEGEKG